MDAGKEASWGVRIRSAKSFNHEGHEGSLRNIPSAAGNNRGDRHSNYIVVRYTINGLSQHDTIWGMKKLSLSDYQALAEFRYQIRKFLRFSEQAVRAAGMEVGQYQLMLAIKGMPDGVRPRIRELANRMHVQHHSAVELINRLESGGYVQRARAQDDRREVLLALTPKGERVLGELALHHPDELRSAAPSLAAALRRLMPGDTKAGRKRAGREREVL